VKKLLLISLGVSSLLFAPAVSALTISSARDNDSNAVIRNGALNCDELQNHFNDSGVSDIFGQFGISSSDINNCGNMVEGVVTNRNNVWIHRSSGQCPDIDTSKLSSRNQQAVSDNPNLCLVATDAMTAGRQDISGSDSVTIGQNTFFMRPPSVSFQTSSLPAFVMMHNNQFAFAIIASCGNPVKATPVTIITPAPKVKSATTTRPTQTTTPVQTQTQSQTQTIVVNQPAPTTTTTTQTQSAPAKALPNTGAGGVAGLAVISTVLGTIGHFIYSRRQLFS
jgi:hypothetical protein